MKYLKMVAISALIAVTLLVYFWFICAIGNIVTLISSALVVPIVLLLAYFLLNGLKGNEALTAGIIMAVVGIAGLFVFVLLANWPWAVIPGQAVAAYDQGIITPYVRIIVAMFNWYAFIGLALGAGIAIPIVINLTKKNKC